jgi:mannosyltransferase OCH1-like enzyme
MIEKKLHYIWLGGEKTEKVKKCIESWHKYLFDYEIIEWNETNINIEEEKKKNKFFKLCYEKKLWGLLTDYLRTKILYENGGIYLDADVEVIKSFNDLLENDFFLGRESETDICYAVIGSIPRHRFLEKMKKIYDEEIWKINKFISTDIIEFIMKKYYRNIKILKSEKIKIYPAEYFYPYYWTDRYTEECIKKNTYAIHRWEGSWMLNPNIAYLQYKHLNPIKRFFKIRKKIRKIKLENEKKI